MQKLSFQKELVISATQKRKGTNNNKKDVQKIQSWLNLFAASNPSSGTATGIDGDFGPSTELAVKNFQKAKGLTQDGVVNQAVFSQMCAPMQTAFVAGNASLGLRPLVVAVAAAHAKAQGLELTIDKQANSGPWVRAYMDGHEGDAWFWCMGFAQAIIDQAASLKGKNFKTLMPLTYSCDTVGTHGLQTGALHRYTAVRSNPALAKPGDLFLLQKTSHDWIHTGIITNVVGDVFETIEGNTNDGGSRNGIAVLKRSRNFQKSKMDVFSIEGLV